MNKYLNLFLLLQVSLLWGACNNSTVKIREVEGFLIIENKHAELKYNLENGTYDAYDKFTGELCVKDACFSVNQYSSTDPGGQVRHYSENSLDELGKGKTLVVQINRKDGPGLIWKATLYEDHKFITMRTGVKNTTSDTLQVMQFCPLVRGEVFPSTDKKNNLSILDGNAGGEPTWVYQSLPVYCRNNVMLTSGTKEQRRTVVVGGITYNDYEKFTELTGTVSRKSQLSERYKELSLLAYLNLPVMREDGYQTGLNLAYGYATQFIKAPHYEMRHLVYAGDSLMINLLNPEKGKPYSVGLSWASDNGYRKQSVWADNGPGTTKVQLCKAIQLPDFTSGQPAEQLMLNVPQEMTDKGNVRIIIVKGEGRNVILQEAWLCEGYVDTAINATPEQVSFPENSNNDSQLTLIAKDPVGKQVDPGQTYIPDDRFYLDLVTTHPFESLEKYAHSLKQAQKVSLQYYDFPSVCLWYAMHPYYGEGPGMNNSVGAVEEMDKIANSGFLKYAKAAVRLVPDCYEDNNEQGWWDDKHFQMHGSGNAVPGEVTVDAHYMEPYETTYKWAHAVQERGGIPLLYVQTGKRSQDYAETYPEHMLFNTANAYVPDFCWTIRGKGGYDFTDPGFIEHMKEVYTNFSKGGLQGLMFDYTNTGWAWYGGMDNSYSTATAAYRDIYRLAREGMGDEAYIHERCLERGSDMTLGLVSSQRIWGDTDDVTPEMVMRGGNRWYKNRVVVNYDMDAKNLLKAKPKDSPDGRRKLLTMCYVTSGRLLLANSFERFDKDILYDLSRVYPFHTTPQSARPVDMLFRDIPTIYDFKVNENWHQVVFYNPDNEKEMVISLPMSESSAEGGIGLASGKSYYAYDFWNDCFLGKFQGSQWLTQTLRPGEARMISIREVSDYPQVLSTNRHLMQGYLELKNVEWKGNTLVGDAMVPGGEDFEIVLATNGRRVTGVTTDKGESSILHQEEPCVKVLLSNNEGNEIVHWSVTFDN